MKEKKCGQCRYHHHQEICGHGENLGWCNVIAYLIGYHMAEELTDDDEPCKIQKWILEKRALKILPPIPKNPERR